MEGVKKLLCIIVTSYNHSINFFFVFSSFIVFTSVKPLEAGYLVTVLAHLFGNKTKNGKY